MVAAVGTKVKVHYIGRTKGAEGVSQEDIIVKCAEYDVFDTSYEAVAKACDKFVPQRNYNQPLEFTVGSNTLIPGFEKGVVGHKAGDVFSVSIPSAEAYGEWSEENIVEVPLVQLPPKNPVGTGEDAKADPYVAGDSVLTPYGPIKIVAVEGENAKIDGNHPLAGKDLIFDIEIVSVEEGDNVSLTESMVESVEEVAKEATEEAKELADDVEDATQDIKEVATDVVEDAKEAVDTSAQKAE